MYTQRDQLSPLLDQCYLDVGLHDIHFYPNTVHRYLACGGGFEAKQAESTNFHAVVDEINNNLCLGLTPVDKQKWSLVLHALSAVERFRGDVLIPNGLGENTGIHVSHCPVLATEIFRRSGLLEPEQQNAEVIMLRINICLCLLSHDIGEFVGEPSSLSERIANSDLQEDPEAEKQILEAALRMLYTSIQRNQTGMFYQLRNAMWDEVQSSPNQPAIKIIKRILKREGIGELNPEYERMLQKDLSFFDRVEHGRDFTGLAAKLIEKLQGTRHWLRFATRDSLCNYQGHFSKASVHHDLSEIVGQQKLSSTIPISRCSGPRIIGNLKYGEKLVGAMMAAANSPVEKILANEIQKAVRETNIEMFSLANPLFDRRPKDDYEMLKNLAADIGNPNYSAEVKQFAAATLTMLQIIEQKALAVECAAIRDVTPTKVFQNQLLPIETRARMMGLYQRAIEVNYKTKPGEILGLIEGKLPAELRGFGRYRRS